jgi:very-short-patch-repair endonuclease
MSASEFVDLHRNDLTKHGGGELAFVEMVLARVRGLDFSAVSYQHDFVDDKRRSRRIDFAVVEYPVVRIAIEVDGYDKDGTGMGMSRAAFDDFMLRQNALTRQGWLLLRFTNSQVRHSPDECARVIEKALTEQRAAGTRDRQSRRVVAWIAWPAVVATPALVAGFFHLPYQFYLIQKVIVSFAIVSAVYYLVRSARWRWAVWLLALGVLFNPISQVYLGSKTLWNVANFVALASLWSALAALFEAGPRAVDNF